MSRTPIKLGPVALILTVISICLTTLSILTFSTAQADLRLAEKYADTVTERHALMDRGEIFLRDAANAAKNNVSWDTLPDVSTDETGVSWYETEDGEMKLTIGIVPDDEKGYEIVAYRITKEWSQDLDPGNLWTGN